MDRTNAGERDAGAASGTEISQAAADVQRMIAGGKCKQAVERAKEVHKRLGTAESELLVVEAYVSRIAQFQQKGAARDAATLLNLVHERFPAHRARFAGLQRRSMASGGRIDELVAPLVRQGLSDAERGSIEDAIRQRLTDLDALAACAALPPDHALRTGAAALSRALAAVTTGPVTEDQIALPEVSRRSPLAGWKLLIRAIAAFYRHEDDACRRFLENIPEGSAVCRLGEVLLSIMAGRSAGGAGAALQARICGGDRRVRDALRRLQGAMEAQDESKVRTLMREALAACAAERPELQETLVQHLSVQCEVLGVPAKLLEGVLPMPRVNAAFWRLHARAHAACGDVLTAAFDWGLFDESARSEGLLADGSPEQAAIYLHAAELICSLGPRDLPEQRRSFSTVMRRRLECVSASPERAQARLQLISNMHNPVWLFSHAAGILGDAETYRAWLNWRKAVGVDREQEDVARRWHQRIPGDPEPLIVLAELAEKRNALKTALGHVAAAEAIDPLNPRVRSARQRLTLANLWRHLKDLRPHLAEKDLAELAAMPLMTEGSLGGCLDLLRAATHAVRGQAGEATRRYQAAAERLGTLAAQSLFQSIRMQARLDYFEQWPEIEAPSWDDERHVAEAEAMVARLTEALRVRHWRPRKWDGALERYLSRKDISLPHADLLAIGRLALAAGCRERAYRASTAGLASATGSMAARLLLLRSSSLPFWANGRISQCLRAAMELAEASHDEALMQDVLEAVELHAPTRMARSRRRGTSWRLGGELVAEVIKAERAARAYPDSPAAADRHVVTIESELPLFQGGPAPFDDVFDEWDGPYDDDDADDDAAWDEAWDDDDDDWEESGDGPGGLLDQEAPPDVRRILAEIVTHFGTVPSSDELIRRQPMLAMRLSLLIGDVTRVRQLIDALHGALDEASSPGSPPDGGKPRRSRKRKRRR